MSFEAIGRQEKTSSLIEVSPSDDDLNNVHLAAGSSVKGMSDGKMN